jgi:hypothetical protein
LPVSFISLRLERVDNLGAYRIPPETGILIPSDFDSYVAPMLSVYCDINDLLDRVNGLLLQLRRPTDSPAHYVEM